MKKILYVGNTMYYQEDASYKKKNNTSQNRNLHMIFLVVKYTKANSLHVNIIRGVVLQGVKIHSIIEIMEYDR